MILTHINTENDIEGMIGIKGSIDEPYITINTQSGYIKVGSYPEKIKIKDYVSKEPNKFLTNDVFQFIFNNSKIGHSSFKLDEGLYMNISPKGFTRFDRISQGLINNDFINTNEIPSSEIDKLNNWLETQGYLPSHEDTLVDTVPLILSNSNPLVTYHTNVITPVSQGGIDGILASEDVWNTWDNIDNNRFMKSLPTSSNLGNFIIVSDYYDVGVDGEPLSSMPELKVKIKSFSEQSGVQFDTINIDLDTTLDSELILSSTKDKNIQILVSKTNTNLTVKLVWNKEEVDTAVITHAVLYNNV